MIIEYVWKKGIFTDPLLQLRMWRKVVWSGACRRRLSHWSTPSLHRRRRKGRIGGDVGSYVKYAIAAVYDDWREERKKIRRACYRLLGVPHTAPIGGWKSVREHPLFQRKIQGITGKSLLERRRRHVPNGTMEWNFAFTLVFCRGGHWRTMIVERGAAKFTAAGSFWKLAIHS